VLFFSLCVAPAVLLVFTTIHGLSIQQKGAVFAGNEGAVHIGLIRLVTTHSYVCGCSLPTILSIHQEKITRLYGRLSATPEGRRYFSCIQSALLPIGLYWFGWASFSSVHWIVAILAGGSATMGTFSVYLDVSNYLASTYHRHASSALAAQSFC